MTFLGAAIETALHRLGHSDGLRQREADRGVDVDAAARRLLDGDMPAAVAGILTWMFGARLSKWTACSTRLEKSM